MKPIFVILAIVLPIAGLRAQQLPVEAAESGEIEIAFGEGYRIGPNFGIWMRKGAESADPDNSFNPEPSLAPTHEIGQARWTDNCCNLAQLGWETLTQYHGSNSEIVAKNANKPFAATIIAYPAPFDADTTSATLPIYKFSVSFAF